MPRLISSKHFAFERDCKPQLNFLLIQDMVKVNVSDVNESCSVPRKAKYDRSNDLSSVLHSWVLIRQQERQEFERIYKLKLKRRGC